MNERIMRMDRFSGDVQIVALDEAVSELSGNGLFSEIAPRLRSGEPVRLPGGVTFRAVASLGEHGVDALPPAAVN